MIVLLDLNLAEAGEIADDLLPFRMLCFWPRPFPTESMQNCEVHYAAVYCLVVVVCGTKAGVVLPEDFPEGAAQHGRADVEKGLHRRPVPAHLLLFVHALGHDLVDRALHERS